MDKPTPRTLRQQRAQLETRIRRIQQREAARERGRQTRRKVLVGVLVLGWMERDAVLARRVYAALNERLVRPVDRAVFGGRLEVAAAWAQGRDHV